MKGRIPQRSPVSTQLACEPGRAVLDKRGRTAALRDH